MAKPNIRSDHELVMAEASQNGGKSWGQYMAFLGGEPQAVKQVLSGTNWRLISLGLGLAIAVVHRILIGNPSVCYLFAKDQVRGFEVTLPEAMASVNAWGWFNLIIYPFQYTMVLAIIAWLIYRISHGLKGTGDYRLYFGLVTGSALILAMGQWTGYLIVNAQDLKRLSDLRDLTPGVGLGLLPLLSLERIGPLWREVVRGFDLFGLGLILFMAGIFTGLEGFGKIKSYWLAGMLYCSFLGFRWLIEGPGIWLWNYFWNYGKI
jgi:hypothetical protein